jgi:hypothetical protein
MKTIIDKLNKAYSNVRELKNIPNLRMQLVRHEVARINKRQGNVPCPWKTTNLTREEALREFFKKD